MAEQGNSETSAERVPGLRVYLVRHGESTWNRIGRFQGQLDPPLSEAGWQQAARIAARLAGHIWQGFYCSDLRRAHQTAMVIAETSGFRPTVDARWREIHLGDWEGMTRAEVIERYPEHMRRWARRPDWDIVPGGEGTQAFRDRVQAVWEELVGRHREGEVLVVSHGGVIQALLSEVLAARAIPLFSFRIDNTAVTTLDRVGAPGAPTRWVVTRVNDAAHLGAG